MIRPTTATTSTQRRQGGRGATEVQRHQRDGATAQRNCNRLDAKTQRRKDAKTQRAQYADRHPQPLKRSAKMHCELRSRWQLQNKNAVLVWLTCALSCPECFAPLRLGVKAVQFLGVSALKQLDVRCAVAPLRWHCSGNAQKFTCRDGDIGPGTPRSLCVTHAPSACRFG